ncbi:pentapeptide repeat-containing protein [Humibacillus xanthopallidus]|nr:pentapeptide repeat-containing protein [Humibacillus xanthopallidus]
MTMNAITTWQLGVDGIGWVQLESSEFRYAGGLVVAVFDGGNGWTVFDLGSSQVAFGAGTQDQDGNNYAYYWNSHYATTDNQGNVGGMMLWLGTSPEFSSDSIGPEQTFRISNLGQGRVSLQATAGSFAGQYLSGVQGGWYPEQWGLGTGSFISSASPAAIRISGDLLPLLQITNSAYDTDLSGRDLGAITLANANLQKSNLSGATLVGVTSISGADFTSASLQGVHLGAHDLATATTWASANFTGSDLTTIAGAASARLEGAILDNANLTGRNLRGAFLQGASLKGAVLTGADLTGAHLDGADLTGAHLGGTILHGASLQGTHFDGVDLSTTQFDAAPQFTRSTTLRTTFSGATVPFPVLGANWAFLDLTLATITGIPSAIGTLVADHALLPTGLSLEKVDLSGASFVGTRMYEIQLQGANLQGATLTNALLKGAKLSGANLTLANLDSAYLIAEGADVAAALAVHTGAGGRLPVREEARPPAPLGQDKLEAAVVTDAFLVNTVLDGAHCDGVDFSGSLFVTSSAVSGSQSASAVGASMNFSKFDGASVVLAVFNGAQLSAASFATADLTGARFLDNGTTPTQLTPSSDTTHTPASVYDAHLEGADFTGANMDGLNMRGATVATAKGQFEKIYDGYAGARVPVAFAYDPTRLGTTTGGTTCPDGSNGPCTL